MFSNIRLRKLNLIEHVKIISKTLMAVLTTDDIEKSATHDTDITITLWNEDGEMALKCNSVKTWMLINHPVSQNIYP